MDGTLDELAFRLFKLYAEYEYYLNANVLMIVLCGLPLLSKTSTIS